MKKQRNSDRCNEVNLEDLFNHENKQPSKKKKLGPLIVVEDLVPLKMFDEGYAIVKGARYFIRGEWHDIAIGHSYRQINNGFYSIPIISVDSESDEEIFKKIRNSEDFQRYFVWTPTNNRPYLVERREHLLFYNTYSVTDFRILSSSKRGRLFMQGVKDLARKLSSMS